MVAASAGGCLAGDGCERDRGASERNDCCGEQAEIHPTYERGAGSVREQGANGSAHLVGDSEGRAERAEDGLLERVRGARSAAATTGSTGAMTSGPASRPSSGVSQ